MNLRELLRIPKIKVFTFPALLIALAFLTSCSSREDVKIGPQEINLAVSISGLKAEDSANLLLLPDLVDPIKLQDNPIDSLSTLAVKNGNYQINLGKLPDGYYSFVIDAPKEYFRDPFGYFFTVRNGQIVIEISKPVSFQLTPSTDMSLPPCRLYYINPEMYKPKKDVVRITGTPQAEQTVCVMEGFIGLSISPKQGESVKP